MIINGPLDKLDWEWDYKNQMFHIHCADGPPLILAPSEVIQLGVQLVLQGMQAQAMPQRWRI